MGNLSNNVMATCGYLKYFVIGWYRLWIGSFLVPRPHYSAEPIRFGSRDPSLVRLHQSNGLTERG